MEFSINNPKIEKKLLKKKIRMSQEKIIFFSAFFESNCQFLKRIKNGQNILVV